MGMLIDASLAIAAERDGLDPHQFVARLGDPYSALAAITASELLHGVHRAHPAANRLRREAFVEALISRLPIIPFDLAIARVHARLSAELAAKGIVIGANDLMLAATAVAKDWEVATHDVRSFPRIPGLRLARW